MSRLNRVGAVVLGAMLGAVLPGLLGGCQNTNQGEPQPTGPAQASPERIASVRQKYAAVEGYVVGDVEEVDAQTLRAAVGGIDPKQVNNQSIFVFVDPVSESPVNSGTMHSDSAVSGRLFIKYFPDGTAPKRGDLVVVKAAGK